MARRTTIKATTSNEFMINLVHLGVKVEHEVSRVKHLLNGLFNHPFRIYNKLISLKQ